MGLEPEVQESSMMIRALVVAATILAATASSAQVGDLIWEDQFTDLDDWIVLTGNGSWGWGNGELQYYSEDNVDIAAVPGEPGNTALRLTARAETGPDIVDQWGNPLSYTSGRVMSRSFVTVRYGLIEARVKMPDLDLGGWPAFWMLGNANHGWPRNGEIDLMEMGAKQAFRDLHDEHNGGNGQDDSTVNQCVGANAIFYTEAAVSPENPSGAASLSWDPDDVFCRPYYDYDDGLVERFLIYRLYWDEDSLRLTVVDDGVERDLYEEPFTIDAESDEFRQPFYFIANLAIGGGFTDAYQLGDPGSGLPVSMPLPAEMLIDYVRVYEWNGQGEVHLGPPTAEAGTFGIFTEETPVDGELVAGVSSEIYVWEGTLLEGSIPPFEGEHALSWQTAGLGWFGAGIMATQPLNLFDFGPGTLEFMIKIPAHVTFKIGVIDSWGNQHYVEFPAHQTTFGLVRDGQWGRASIPISELRGPAIDLRLLSYPFVILEENGTPCEFAIDDIYWASGTTVAVDDRPRTPAAPGLSLAGAPNPFNPRTTLRYELPQAGPVRLEIFDLRGRRVRELVAGVLEAGSHAVTWDGRDHRGGEVATGVYLARISLGGEAATIRLTLAR
jgi:beta-glucanase (GH16 family)